MNVDRFIDAMAGDEHSKSELKLAYRKAFKVGAFVALTVFVICLLISFVLFPNTFNFDVGSLHLTTIIRLFFSALISLVLGAFIGSQSLNFFTKRLKITLPESIAPRIEAKHR